MAESAVSLVTDKLIQLLVEEANLLGGIHKEVEDITDELASIQSFLRIADTNAGKEGSDEGVKTWVKQVREAAYSIEDVVDEYLLHMSQCRHQLGFISLLRKITCFVSSLRPRHEIAAKIQDIKVSLCEIKNRSERYDFSSIHKGSSSNSNDDPRVASLFVKEAELVGTESARQELIGWLVNGAASRRVVSVVGMGGLGKTTTAKMVYDNETVSAYFECHAWVTVSQSYVKEELLRNLIVQLHHSRKESSPEGIDSMNEVSLITSLRDYLQQKSYMVVFDDVWKVDFWVDREHALLDSNTGSRILITTRNKDVADFCKKSAFVSVHELQPLPPKEAWELFCRKTFQFDDSKGQCPQELEKLSVQIVEKCRGLPLAIVAIAGLLCTKDKIVPEWKKFHDSLGSELQCNAHLKSTAKILSLSYADLPYYLKPCFLYFGIFPEDFAVNKPKLVSQRIAEGFVKGKKGKTCEEVAKDYLDELVRRNLVEMSWGEFNGVNRNYRVHDLIREIILSRIEELSFCQSLGENDSCFNRKARRLSICNSTDNVKETIGRSRVRSFFLFKVHDLPESLIADLCKKFVLLKILDLEDSPLTCLPEGVGKLFHLRYLCVKNTKLKMLPKSIGMLQNLETLNLKKTLVQELPAEINRLQKLRHLLAGYYSSDSEVDFGLCSLQGVRIQKGFGCLKDLQTLSYVEANHGISLVKELENLTQLMVLGITNLTRDDVMDLCPSIKKMNQLFALELVSRNGDEVLDLQSISSPPVMMQDIFLRGRLQKLPKWMQALENVVTVGLFSSRLEDDPLIALQALPNLAYLYLYKAYDGELIHVRSGGFCKLKLLSLRNSNRLKRIVMDKGALGCLEELHIGPSPDLKEVPTGFDHLRDLKTVLFYDMSKEFASRLIPNGGHDHWKVKHVLAVHFSYRIEGERYETYKIGDSKLLKHLGR